MKNSNRQLRRLNAYAKMNQLLRFILEGDIVQQCLVEVI